MTSKELEAVSKHLYNIKLDGNLDGWVINTLLEIKAKIEAFEKLLLINGIKEVGLEEFVKTFKEIKNENKR